MMLASKFLPRSFLACVLALAMPAAGCVHVLESVPMQASSSGKMPACRNGFGAYYLPKRVLALRVDETRDTQNDTRAFELSFGYRQTDGTDHGQSERNGKIELAESEPYRTVADRRQEYCIDYFGSAFAEDFVSVQRTKEQLLTRVFSNAKDKSQDIATKLIDAGGKLAASLLAGGLNRASFNATDELQKFRAAEYELDPFNRGEISEINDELKRFGYCVYLKRNRDPFIPEWMDYQCPTEVHYTPARFVPPPPPRVKVDDSYSGIAQGTSKASNRVKPVRGILYKPLLTHTLVIMKKEDPTSSLPWKTYETRRLVMPNAAPPFLLEINRAAFTTRTTDINFDHGILKDVYMDKGSELDAFVNIPIRAIEVLVQVPVQALTVAQNRAENQKRLVEVNQQVIQLLADIKSAETSQQDKLGALSPEDLALLAIGNRQLGSPVRRSSPEERSLSLSACIQNAEGLVEGDVGAYCRREVNRQLGE